MAGFTFERRYAVGIKAIDDEHARLIGLMEELRMSMSLGKGRQVIGPVLRALLDYTRTHFVNEEELMKKHGFPEFENHKELHDQFVEGVVKATRDYIEGRSIPAQKIKELLFDWLVEHIQEQDKRMAKFLLAKGVSPEHE